MPTAKGLKKYIESPAKLWGLFVSYKESIKGKPIAVQDFVGAMATEVERKKERPLTMEGFENYVADLDIINGLGDYFSNYGGRYADYSAICSRIKRCIRQDQIEGGMAGIYNPSITQRLNNLVEKVQEDGTKELTIKVKYERKDSNIEPSTPEPTESN
jgi:hypothetical protein